MNIQHVAKLFLQKPFSVVWNFPSINGMMWVEPLNNVQLFRFPEFVVYLMVPEIFQPGLTIFNITLFHFEVHHIFQIFFANIPCIIYSALSASWNTARIASLTQPDHPVICLRCSRINACPNTMLLVYITVWLQKRMCYSILTEQFYLKFYKANITVVFHTVAGY